MLIRLVKRTELESAYNRCKSYASRCGVQFMDDHKMKDGSRLVGDFQYHGSAYVALLCPDDFPTEGLIAPAGTMTINICDDDGALQVLGAMPDVDHLDGEDTYYLGGGLVYISLNKGLWTVTWFTAPGSTERVVQFLSTMKDYIRSDG